MNIGIIVIGGHVQGLGITRIYGKNNIPVLLLDDTKVNLTRHSKYCKKFILYKKSELLTKLLEIGESNQYQDWVLVPTNDAHVEVLSKNKLELGKYYKVSTDDFKVLKYFFNKRLSYKLVDDLDIPIPKTWMPDVWETIKDYEISYPCIIKPAVMHTFYSKTKKKVFVCKDIGELKSNYLLALKIIPQDEVIVQEIIPGNSEHQYSVCYMFDGEKSLVSLTGRRARQHPPDFGNATTFAETCEIPIISKYAERILKTVNYKGLCEVEFKYDIRDKKYKFLEVNPRTWKWHSISEKSESPFLMSLFNYLFEKEPIVNNNPKPACFRHIITDVPTILRMKLNGLKTKSSCKNMKYAVWQGNDFIPALFEIFYLPYLIFKR